MSPPSPSDSMAESSINFDFSALDIVPFTLPGRDFLFLRRRDIRVTDLELADLACISR